MNKRKSIVSLSIVYLVTGTSPSVQHWIIVRGVGQTPEVHVFIFLKFFWPIGFWSWCRWLVADESPDDITFSYRHSDTIRQFPPERMMDFIGDTSDTLALSVRHNDIPRATRHTWLILTSVWGWSPGIILPLETRNIIRDQIIYSLTVKIRQDLATWLCV